MIDLAAVLHAASTTTTTLAKTSHSSGSILDPIAKPLAALLAGIYAVIPNYGVAIMGLSVLWMVIISPLTLKSTRSMLAMQKLQPELKKLQEKHKNDRQAFAQAQMDLFREHNVSPFGSCLPMLLPLPVFFALFRVIDGLSHTVNGVTMPKYLNPGTQMYKSIVAAHGQLWAFGMDLSKGALSHHDGIAAAAPYWIALLVMGGTSYLQSAMMMNRTQSAATANPQMRMMKYFRAVVRPVLHQVPSRCDRLLRHVEHLPHPPAGRHVPVRSQGAHAGGSGGRRGGGAHPGNRRPRAQSSRLYPASREPKPPAGAQGPEAGPGLGPKPLPGSVGRGGRAATGPEGRQGAQTQG